VTDTWPPVSVSPSLTVSSLVPRKPSFAVLLGPFGLCKTLAFLDKCGQSEDFRLAVKRTRPKTLQEAVVNAMQEECSPPSTHKSTVIGPRLGSYPGLS
jgi:hypothetical protein